MSTLQNKMEVDAVVAWREELKHRHRAEHRVSALEALIVDVFTNPDLRKQIDDKLTDFQRDLVLSIIEKNEQLTDTD